MSYLLGIFMILSATVPEQLQRIHWLTRINPIQANFIWQFPAICLGLGFILIGRALQGRSRRAWSVSLCWLLLTLAYLNLHDFSLYSNLYLVIMTGLIIAIRPVLTSRQFIYSLEGLSMDGVILLATMILYLYFMTHHWPLSLGTGDYSETLPALGTSWLYHFVSLSLLALAYTALYHYLRRPVSDPQKSGLYQTFDEERLQAFLQVYSGNDTTGLIFLQDKFLYWYSEEGDDRVLLPYSLYPDKLVVMGAPIGEPDLVASAIQALTDEAAQWSYSVIFYEVDEGLTMILHDFGFDFMKFGQNASIDLTSFKITGKHNKGLKATMNSLTHQGYQFDIVSPPHSDSLLLDLQQISDHWLHQRREKGFSVGFFEPSYLNRAPLALLKNSDQAVVAFANLMPNYQSKRLSIDLMRYDDSLAAKGSMDFLFVKLMLYAQDQGYQSFDLGMSPLANVGRVTNSFLNERFAYLIFEYSHRFYSFEGLHQYKQKFKPQWTNRYLCYQRNSWLFTSLLVILQLTLRSRSLAPLKHSPRLLSYIHIIERPR